VVKSVQDYKVPPRTKLARTILRPIFKLLFRVISKVKVTGLVNIPKSGSYLIAINHISLFDVPFVLAFWPKAPEGAGAVDIWQRPGQSILVRLYGGIPVHRGQYDRRLLEIMISILRSGKPLLIAPEGGRSHKVGMRKAYPGVAYIVDKTQVPVIPVGVTGATDDFLKNALRFKRPKIEMRVGAPFYLPPIKGRGDTRRMGLQKNADMIMLQIAGLLPDEYGGYYADACIRSSETA
jgi:1-acyl-sn-glycerol-3-phosphate acyltransferase